MADPVVDFVETLKVNLDSVPIVNGQLIYVSDTSEIYRDTSSSRKSINDFITKDTESQILDILAPLSNKFYYAKDTKHIWTYNGQWNCLNQAQTYATTEDIANLFN